MSNWSDGYVTDVGYTHGYYREFNPHTIHWALTCAGLRAPRFETACELGYGQGIGINLNAAASTVRWHGTDFNPSQAAHAIELAEVAGSGADLRDASFADYAADPGLPQFDLIALHGIWTWVSDENRRIIVDFIRRKLRTGGVVYISYNTAVGWLQMLPLRELWTEHARLISPQAMDSAERVRAALAFSDRLLQTQPMHMRTNNAAAERYKRVKDLNPNYLAHEYFNGAWAPSSFAEVARWLEPARLAYACSGHLLDQVDSINLSAEQTAFLAEIGNPMFRQSVRDMLSNQQFRRDLWVKGPRPLDPVRRVELLRAQRVALLIDPADMVWKVNGARGAATMAQPVYQAVLDVLAQLGPTRVGEVERAVAGKGVSFGQLIEVISVLFGKGDLSFTVDETQAALVSDRVQRINRHLMEAARGSSDVGHLASALTGGGVLVPRFTQLFLLARQQGIAHAEGWVDFAWNALKAQGQRIVQGDKKLMTDEENIAELSRQAAQLASRQLAVLRRLQLA